MSATNNQVGIYVEHVDLTHILIIYLKESKEFLKLMHGKGNNREWKRCCLKPCCLGLCFVVT